MVLEWDTFHEITKGRPPRQELVEALEFVEHNGQAIDIGAGALNETRYLLDQGFEVTAIDSTPAAAGTAERINDDRLHFYAANYGDFVFPANRFDLAVALYSLPFTPKERFETTVKGVLDSVRVGGVFVGNLFGLEDEWNEGQSSVNFVSESAARTFFDGFNMLRWQEEKGPGRTATGEAKYWHIYHLIAKKR